MRLAAAFQKVDITAVPFGIEIVVTGALRADQLGRHDISGIHRLPVVAITAADGEKVGALIVFPRLKVEADLVVVFRVDLVNLNLQANLGDRHVIFAEHGGDIVAGIVFDIENQPVQIRIVSHEVLPLPQLGDVADVHAHIFDQRHKVFGRNEFRQINEHLTAVVQRPEVGIVQHRHQGVNADAVLIVVKTILFGADDQQSGAVNIFQALHRRIAAQLHGRGVARLGVGRRQNRRALGGDIRPRRGVAGILLLQRRITDTLGLHHLAQIVAKFVGIDVLQQIGLGHHARVVVVADEVDDFGVVLDIDGHPCLDSRRIVASGVVEVRVPRHAGDFRRRQ